VRLLLFRFGDNKMIYFNILAFWLMVLAT
jgi:hypothetical protein